MLQGRGMPIASLMMAVVLQVLDMVSGGTFERLCISPTNQGQGVLKDNKCTVTYRLRSPTYERAYEICENTLPFDVVEANNGSRTVCVYERPQYFCDNYGEELVDDRCVQVRGYGRFGDHESECGDRHTIHIVRSSKELSWVSYFFSQKSHEVWVGNRGENAKNLKPVIKETMKNDVPLSQLPIKIRIATCCLDGHRKGTALYGRTFERNAFLCSRPAGVFHKGVERYATTIRQFGYAVEFGRDAYGDPRPFAFLPVEYSDKDLHLGYNLRKLHQMCNVFLNGYIASRFDFYDGNEYRRVLSKFPDVPLRTTIGRDHRAKKQHHGKVSLAKTAMRNQWTYYYPGNVTLEVPSSHWAYPEHERKHWRLSNSVLMTRDGYVQGSITEKYGVVCTFGNPLELRTAENSLVCDKAARFNERTGECYCLRPDSDGRSMDLDLYDRHPPGLACLSCESYAEKRSVVFIVSSEAVVREDGWRKQLKFVAGMLSHVENVRVGVVVVGCPSYVDLPMDTYKPDELRKWAETKPYIDSATNARDAYRYARMLLNKESSPSKTLVVLHNGKTTNCLNGRDDISGYAYVEQKTADEMRKAGIRIIYVAIDEYDLVNIIQIAGGIQHVVRLQNHNILNTRVAHYVLKRFCDHTVDS